MEKNPCGGYECSSQPKTDSEFSLAGQAAGLHESEFIIPKMDCPSEERLIKFALSELRDVYFLQFDLPRGRLSVFHVGEIDPIASRLFSFGLGASLIKTTIADQERLDTALLANTAEDQK